MVHGLAAGGGSVTVSMTTAPQEGVCNDAPHSDKKAARGRPSERSFSRHEGTTPDGAAGSSSQGDHGNNNTDRESKSDRQFVPWEVLPVPTPSVPALVGF